MKGGGQRSHPRSAGVYSATAAASKSGHTAASVSDAGSVRLALFEVLMFNCFLTYKNGNFVGLSLIELSRNKTRLNCGQLQKFTYKCRNAIFFFSCKLPEIRSSYVIARVSFTAPRDLLPTWSYSTFPAYTITTLAIADFCCHFRVKIPLLTIPIWEMIKK